MVPTQNKTGGVLVLSQFGGGKFGRGNFGGSKEQGMRHVACKAQGDGGTKQEAPGSGMGKSGGQIETPNLPHQIYSPRNPLPLMYGIARDCWQWSDSGWW